MNIFSVAILVMLTVSDSLNAQESISNLEINFGKCTLEESKRPIAHGEKSDMLKPLGQVRCDINISKNDFEKKWVFCAITSHHAPSSGGNTCNWTIHKDKNYSFSVSVTPDRSTGVMEYPICGFVCVGRGVMSTLRQANGGVTE